jgi:hypothetical protein
MGQSRESTIPGIADSSLVGAGRFLRVKITGTSNSDLSLTVGACGANDGGIGVIDNQQANAVGDQVNIYLNNDNKTKQMQAGGPISFNSLVYAAAAGQVLASGSLLVGLALQAASGAGSLIEVLPINQGSGSGSGILAAGTSQDTYAASATQNYALGSPRDFSDGRRFRYAQAGASNITRALMQQSAALNTFFSDITQTGHAQVAGATAITILCTTGSAVAANYFAGGKLLVTTGTNKGDTYPVVSSALEGTDTLMDLVLGEPLRNAIAATDKVTLIPNRWSNTIVVPATTATGAPAGVPAVDVTAAYFYWAQTRGPAAMIVDTGDTLVVGGKGGIPATDAVAGAVGAATATAYAFPFYGTVMSIGVAGETALINLELE